MTRSTAVRLTRVALAAAIGLTLAACGGGNIQNAPAPSGGGGAAADCGKLNMAINPWVGYEASAHVVGNVAKTKLGCDVEYKNVKEEVAWQGMGNGEVDVVIENWGHPDLVQKYITEQKTAQDAGPNGNIGVIGWYVPPCHCGSSRANPVRALCTDTLTVASCGFGRQRQPPAR